MAERASDAPRCWVIVPAKPRGEGKSRLSPALAPDQRVRLVEAMLDRVVAAARECPAVERVCLLSSGDHGLGVHVTVLADTGGGLNAVLDAALRAVAEPSPDRVIIVAGDLPVLEAADFAMLAALGADTIGIAPDRHGAGTNALSLPIAACPRFRCRFGVDSYLAHRQEAERLGYQVDTLLSDGLEKDIDEPVDLADAGACLQAAL